MLKTSLQENHGSFILTGVWLFASFMAILPLPPQVGMLFAGCCFLIVAYVCIEVFVLAVFGNMINLPPTRLTFDVRLGFFFANLACVIMTLGDLRFIEGGIAFVALVIHELLETRAYRANKGLQDG